MAEYTRWQIGQPNVITIVNSRTYPDRPVDWRWKRAVGIVEGTEPQLSRIKDSALDRSVISRAIKYIQHRLRVSSQSEEYELAMTMPDMFWAHHLHGQKDGILKHSIEAHTLAAAQAFDISLRVNYAPTIVSTYQNTFYDVQERLSCKNWVVHTVLGLSVHNGLAERQFDLLWKLYGLMMGSEMVDALETKFVNPQRPASADTVGAAVEDDTIATMKLKANLAAKSIIVNGSTASMLLDHYTKFVEIERNSDSKGQAQSTILQDLSTLFATFPLAVGKDTRIKNRVRVSQAQQNLDQYEKSAVELNWRETITVASGVNLADARRVTALGFPTE